MDYRYQYQEKRLVLFVGPHKAASTTIQSFLIEHAANYQGEARFPSFVNWTWPFEPFAKHFDALGDLVMSYARKSASWHDSRRAQLYFTLDFVWQHSPHVVMGHEEYDRMGRTPYSHRNGLQAIQNILRLLQPPNLDVVVNYRTPRQEHWISIWKQLSQGSANYRAFACQGRKPWEHLNSVSNPLFLVRTLLRNDIKNVTMIDMGGVQRDGLDIAHTLACEVMRVPCHQGWVEGLNHTAWRKNVRTKEHGLTSRQSQEMEWLFQQRDCSYQDDLHPFLQDGSFRVLHWDKLWENCTLATPQFQKSLQNTSYFLDLMQHQADCDHYDNETIAPSERTYISELMAQQAKLAELTWDSKISPPAMRNNPNGVSVLRHSNYDIRLPIEPPPHLVPNPNSSTVHSSFSDGHLIGVAIVQHCIFLLAVVVTCHPFRRTSRRLIQRYCCRR